MNKSYQAQKELIDSGFELNSPFFVLSKYNLINNTISLLTDFSKSYNLLNNFGNIKYGNTNFSRLFFPYKENFEIDKYQNNIAYKKATTNLLIEENHKNENIDEFNFKSTNINDNIEKPEIEKINIKENNISRKINVKPKTLRKIFNLKIYDDDFQLITKKRGRVPLNNKINHIHSAMDYDNVLRKVQVHCLTFLVNLTNDYIISLSKDIKGTNIPYFRHIDYKIKRQINHSYIKKIKNSKIGDILQLPVSKKNRACQDNQNVLTYMEIIKLFPFLEERYFSKSLKEFFRDYYYNKFGNSININGVNVTLSFKTKSFNNLIEKNTKYADKLKNIAFYFYVHGENETIKDTIKEGKNEKPNTIRQKPFFIIE